MIEDAKLLEAARKLDKTAFADIFDAYAPLIYKYVLRLSHDSVVADDVVGEVFSQLLTVFSSGKGPRENLRSYLYQMSYNKFIDHGRSEKRLVDLDVAADMRFSGTISEDHEKRILLEALDIAIKRDLSTDQQHVIILRFLEGFSIQETAEILGKDINNIKVIQNRAVVKLRQVLNQETEVTP